MLSHWKLEKMKTQQKKTRRAAVYIVYYDNRMQHPKVLSQVLIWWKTCKSSLTYGFTDPIGKEKRPGRFLITNKIEDKFPGYLRELYQHAMRVHTNEALIQGIMVAMM